MDYKSQRNEAIKICNECKDVYEDLSKYKYKTNLTYNDTDYVFSVCSRCIKDLQSISLIFVKEKIAAYYLVSQFRDLYLKCYYMIEE